MNRKHPNNGHLIPGHGPRDKMGIEMRDAQCDWQGALDRKVSVGEEVPHVHYTCFKTCMRFDGLGGTLG